MRTVQIKDKLKYAKAFGVVFRTGGFFRTRPPRVLVVNERQYEQLLNAGLLGAERKKGRGRGQKKEAAV